MDSSVGESYDSQPSVSYFRVMPCDWSKTVAIVPLSCNGRMSPKNEDATESAPRQRVQQQQPLSGLIYFRLILWLQNTYH
jgi:hypothetical protein